MFLTKFAIERPIVVRMAFFLIVIFGIYAYQAMPRFLDHRHHGGGRPHYHRLSRDFPLKKWKNW